MIHSPRSFLFGLSFLSALGLSRSASAATGTTDPLGYTTVSLLAHSDTYVSMPVHRPAAFVGQVASVSGNTLTLAGSPNFSANQFVYAAGSQSNTYYAFIRSGAKEGNYYTITANGGNSLTIDLAGDTLSGLSSGDSVSVIPYWTLGTVFPASDVGVSFAPSLSVLSRPTQILMPDLQNSGINLATVATYFYYNGAWRRFGQSLSLNKNDDIFTPDAYFIVRNAATSGTLTSTGSVGLKKFVVPLLTRTGGKQDNAVALPRPVPVTLNDSGLVSSGAFAVSPSLFQRTDELLVIDNTLTGINKSASATYFYYNGAWRKIGASLSQDFGSTVVFGPQTGVQIRKAASVAGASADWINTPAY